MLHQDATEACEGLPDITLIRLCNPALMAQERDINTPPTQSYGWKTAVSQTKDFRSSELALCRLKSLEKAQVICSWP